eukprot:8761580-Pyramimonas_sp.AAC.1
MHDNQVDHRLLLAARRLFFGHLCSTLGKMPYVIQNSSGESINGLYFDGVKASSIAPHACRRAPCLPRLLLSCLSRRDGSSVALPSLKETSWRGGRGHATALTS